MEQGDAAQPQPAPGADWDRIYDAPGNIRGKRLDAERERLRAEKTLARNQQELARMEREARAIQRELRKAEAEAKTARGRGGARK